MKYISLLITMFISLSVSAGGRTNWTVPTQIDIERGNGVMLYGAFGNANGCTISNTLYINKDHPQYDQIYSAALSALSTGAKIRAYVHSCQPVTWYSIPSTTYNVLTPAGDFQIKSN